MTQPAVQERPATRAAAPAKAPDLVPLGALVRAELMKLFGSYAVWGIAAGAAVATAVAVAGQIAGASRSHLDLDTAAGLREVLGAAGAGQIFALALGILHSAGEFRHGMAARTFLQEPQRRWVVWAKACAVALVSLGYGVLVALVALAVALPWLSAKHAAVSPVDGTVLAVLGGTIAATTLYGVIGVGIGFVGRAPAGTLIAGIAWFLVVETALLKLWPDGARFLPGGAAEALAQGKGPDLLAPGWGGLLLCGWTVLAIAVASWDVERRDVSA
ncbi:MAG TPA: hypothetical protein VH418_02455 [Solirubrobacteraceae bacterium]